MRIGVIADTHVGEHVAAVPAEVAEAFAGVDLILHAGDLNTRAVIGGLERIAPVVAVRGNHDTGLSDLPRDVVVRVGDRRIGLTHGSRTALVEMPAAALSLALGRPVLLGFSRAMRARFGQVDAVVTGHLHMPIHRMVDGVLHFSPGAVYVPEIDPEYDWSGWRGEGYRRFRLGLDPPAREPAVGIMEVGPGGVRAETVPLTRPITLMRPPPGRRG